LTTADTQYNWQIRMINAALILSVVVTGFASQYAPRVMSTVIANRQSGRTRVGLPQELPDVHGYIAVLSCDDVGKIYYLRPAGCEDCGWERFLAADCAGVSDGGYAWMERNGVPCELDYDTVLRWGERYGKNYIGRGIMVDMAVEKRGYNFD